MVCYLFDKLFQQPQEKNDGREKLIQFVFLYLTEFKIIFVYANLLEQITGKNKRAIFKKSRTYNNTS